MNYKQKLAQIWTNATPTAEEILDVVADFCDDLGSRIELHTDIYDTAGKIFACIWTLKELEAQAAASLAKMKLNNQDDAIAELQMRVAALEEAQKLREGEL